MNDAIDVITEKQIQETVNDYLDWEKIQYYRIPDSYFRWIKMNAPLNIQKWFFGMFGGMPDNLCLIPLGNGIALALMLELKSKKGRLHGKQKDHSEEWLVCKEVNSALNAIAYFKMLSKEMQSISKKFGKHVKNFTHQK